MSKKNKNLNYNYNLELGSPIDTVSNKYIGEIRYDNYSKANPYGTTQNGDLTSKITDCESLLNGESTRTVDKDTDHPIEFTCSKPNEYGEQYLITTSGQSFQPNGYNCTYIGTPNYIDWHSDCSPQGGIPPYNNFNVRAHLSNGRGLCMADSFSSNPIPYDNCIISTYGANLSGIFSIGDDLFDVIKQKKLDYDTSGLVVRFGSGPNDTNDFSKNSILTYLNECNSVAVAYCSEFYPTDLCKPNYGNNTFRIKSSDTNKSGLDSSLCHDLVIFSNTDSTNGVQGILEVDNDDNPTYVKLVPYTGGQPKNENIFTLHKHQFKDGLIDIIYYNSSKNAYIMQANTNDYGDYNWSDLHYGTSFYWNSNAGPWGINLVSSAHTNPEQRFSKIQITTNDPTLEWSIFNCSSSHECDKIVHDYCMSNPWCGGLYNCTDTDCEYNTFCNLK